LHRQPHRHPRARRAARQTRPAFDQIRPVCTTLCFRAREREHVDAIYRVRASTSSARRSCTRPRTAAVRAGYYSLLFEDPDGIRVEVNHVPGKGHLRPGRRLGEGGAGPSTGLGRVRRVARGMVLEGYASFRFTHDGEAKTVYRRGAGPAW
jgi:hypothetical protein